MHHEPIVQQQPVGVTKVMPDLPTPYRKKASGSNEDDPAEIFALLEEGSARGLSRALLTIVHIDGGGPRPLGTHMAVLEDGAFCGYVSGGCVEPAIAAEALAVIKSGTDRVLRFGRGSPLLDIRLPCGGGFDLLVHVNPDVETIRALCDAIDKRQFCTLELPLEGGAAAVRYSAQMTAESDPHGEIFLRNYVPTTRLVLVGNGPEFRTTLRMANAGGFVICAHSSDDDCLALASELGIEALPMTRTPDFGAIPIDPWTAIAFMLHDQDREAALLKSAVTTNAFYIGALGSLSTHKSRVDRLRVDGVSEACIDRIRAPLGLFGSARDAQTLAVSLLAQVVKERRDIDAST